MALILRLFEKLARDQVVERCCKEHGFKLLEYLLSLILDGKKRVKSKNLIICDKFDILVNNSMDCVW